MRKITDFVVNKRYFILVLFVILTIISGIFSRKVKINYDIAEYLPDTSETRIGMDIIEKEFAGTETSTLNLMFKDLPDKEKTEVKENLEKIKGVESVDYDETEKYNKKNYTLYVITVDDKEDSELAKNVYNNVIEKYDEKYTIYTSGNVSDTNKTVLPFGIIVLAVGCALVILIIMCESYIEPFLFLTAILMAVVLNSGTNIIFGMVSNITNSISAILQLALSMDYSIMLMNRYTQEKETEKDKVKAMKKALYHAFQAISSSSVTTIVGLLALVFMSFTIGRDLGFVLAKGVLFSLICIFFVLPALILLFDKLITKTKKKTPNIKLTLLGKFSHKMRFVAIPLFLLVFVGSFVLKGNLGYDYTQTQQDDVSTVFEENNQMAIIYKNDEEEKIVEYLEKLENDKKVDEVLAYGNTINEELTYDKLNESLNDLGSSVNIEDYMLKIIYYDYFTPEVTSTYSFDEFVRFVENDVYTNEKMNEEIDEETRNNITRLKNFITNDEIYKSRKMSDIATILEVDQDKLSDIIILYLSQNDTIQININDFINFMNNEVLTNQRYGSKVGENERASLNKLSVFSNIDLIQRKMGSDEISGLFGIDSNILGQNPVQMTPLEFTNFILLHKDDEILSGKIDQGTIGSLSLLQTVMNGVVSGKTYSSSELSSLLGMNLNDLKLIYGLYGARHLNPNPSISLKEFVDFLLEDVVTNQEYSQGFDEDKITKLNTVNKIMNDSLNGVKYTSSEMFDIATKLTDNMEKKTLDLLYIYNGSINSYNSEWTMTVEKFVNFLNDNVLNDEKFTDFIEDDMRNDIVNAKSDIVDAKELLIGKNYSRIVLNTKYSAENKETFDYIKNLKKEIGKDVKEFYIVGDSPMAYEMSQTFNDELNLITVITMIAIFIVVAVTFKSLIIPIILVLTIQCAVFLIMGILSFTGENVYFIAMLIVQSILMGATIDYAILYTSYYLEYRKTLGVKESLVEAYNNSIHTILTSSSILIIVTLIIANFASAIAAKICKTVSQGTLCSTLLILILLPSVLAGFDRIIVKKKKVKEEKK